MKILYSITLLLVSNICSANLIDSIKNKTDLKLFLARYAKEVDYVLYDSQHFYKIDIDKNGLTDVCINASNFWIILDKGQNMLETHYFRGAEFSYKGFIETDSVNFLSVKVKKPLEHGYDTTLFYTNGRFLEYVRQPSVHSISRIEFEYIPGFCFDCNSYRMTIDSTRQARFLSDRINTKRSRIDTVKGHLVLDTRDFNAIINTLNSMKFEQLDDHYSIHATDQPFSTVTIHYDNGKMKKIEDLGMTGTLWLSYFYEMVDELYTTKEWHKTTARGPKLTEAFK